MNITKYVDYFHDGGLIDIKHVSNRIELFLISAEIDPDDFEEYITLDKNNSIAGILHLEQIKNILRNDIILNGNLKMEYQSGRILNLEIKIGIIEIVVEWSNWKPKELYIDCSKITIKADNIYWENKPDLVDPYW